MQKQQKQTEREKMVELIRQAGAKGFTAADYARKAHISPVLASCRLSQMPADVMVYEEQEANNIIRYFWCGK